MEDEVVYEEQAQVDEMKAPFTKPSPFLDRLAVGVRALEEWYAGDFERRITEITGLLRTEITEELRSQFTAELNLNVDRIRTQYEERVYVQFRQWESEGQALKKVIEELQNQLPSNDILNEIAATEAAFSKSFEAGPSDAEREATSAAALGQLLQTRAHQLELRAYLRGLRFTVERKRNVSQGTAPGFSEHTPENNSPGADIL